MNKVYDMFTKKWMSVEEYKELTTEPSPEVVKAELKELEGWFDRKFPGGITKVFKDLNI